MRLKETVGLALDRPIDLRGIFRETTRLSLAAADRLVELGLEKRPEMIQMEHQIRLREETVGVARAGILPKLDFVASGQMQFQSNDPDLGETISDYDEWRRSWVTGVTLQMPLFDGLETRSRVDQAKTGLRQARLEEERIGRSIRRQIRQAWLDVEAAESRLAAERRTVEQAEEGLQIAESRYKSGAGTQLEILDAQLVLGEAEIGHATARRDRALALVALERAVGILGEAE